MNYDDHLNAVLTELDRHGFSKPRWEELGLKLKLKPTALEVIKSNHGSEVAKCLKECIAKWLKTDEATHNGLVIALAEMGENAVANKLTI